MGLRSIFRGQQQSLAKEITTDFANDFKAEDAADFASSLVSNTAKQTRRGRAWKFVRGTWGLSSSKLSSTTSGSDYPITIVDALVPDVELTVKDIGQGAGASLWYTDSGNWWGVVTNQTTTSCNCSTYYYPCNPSFVSTCCSGHSETTCNHPIPHYTTTYYGTYYCVDTVGVDKCSYSDCAYTTWRNYNFTFGYTNYQCVAGEVCNYRVWGTTCYADSYTTPHYVCSSSTTRFVCDQGGCGYTVYSSCQGTSCETCYPQYIRVIQSVANQVSEMVSWAVSATVKALRIKTNNKTIQVDAYSDAEATSAVDSTLSYDASSATESTKFGVMGAPSSYGESRSVSKINIRRNR